MLLLQEYEMSLRRLRDPICLRYLFLWFKSNYYLEWDLSNIFSFVDIQNSFKCWVYKSNMKYSNVILWRNGAYQTYSTHMINFSPDQMLLFSTLPFLLYFKVCIIWAFCILYRFFFILTESDWGDCISNFSFYFSLPRAFFLPFHQSPC